MRKHLPTSDVGAVSRPRFVLLPPFIALWRGLLRTMNGVCVIITSGYGHL